MDRAILIAIASFAVGVLASSFVFISPLVSLLILFVGLSIAITEKIYGGIVGPEIVLVCLVLLFFSVGALRYAIKDFHEPEVPSATGIVESEPEQKENATRFVFHADNGEKVVVRTEIYSSLHYGDRVQVERKLERPGSIEDPENGRSFDYAAYLAKDDVYYTMSFAKVEVLSRGHGHPLKTVLFAMKRNFIEQATSIFSDPQVSLLSGLLVAGKDAMPKDILESFRRAGVIHIVVLSGFNITLIADAMRRMFQGLFLAFKLTRYPQAPALFSIIGIVLFVMMTGGEATVVRAAIMALTVIIAKFVGGNYSAIRALIVAATLMLLHNPKILVFDPSFQLSFLATLGLIYLMQPIEKYLSWITARWNIREIVSQTLATQCAVLPLLVYSMGDMSLVSLPANLLVLIVVPTTMLVGFLAIIVSYIGAALAWPIAFLGHLLLSWILLVSEVLGNLPFASIGIPLLSPWIIVVVYAAMVALVWKLKKTEVRR